MIPDFTTLPKSVSIVNNTAVFFFFFFNVQGGVKVLVLTMMRLSVCRWWEEMYWQERDLVQGHYESGLICLPSWTDSWITGEGCQREGPGPLKACLGRVCCGSVHGCVAPGDALGVMSARLQEHPHVYTCVYSGGSCCKPPSCSEV